MDTKKLQVYYDGFFHVVAYDPDDAILVLKEEKIIIDGDKYDTFEIVPDDRVLTFDSMDDEQGFISRSAAGWAEPNGRGYLASEDY